MNRKLHVLRSPFALAAMAQALAMAGTHPAPDDPSQSGRQRPPEPPEPPKTQRLRMLDDDGLRYLNEAKAKRAARNEKRARDFARQKR